MKTRLHLLLCGVVVVVLTTTAALFLGMRREQGTLEGLAARMASRIEAEFSETVLLASVLSQHQSIVSIARGRAATTALDSLVIQTGLSAIVVHDEQGHVIAEGHRRQTGSPLARPVLNTNGLSKRFVRDEGQSGLFVVSYPIKGAPKRRILTLYQPLEDQALYWRAISENIKLTGPNGNELYAHDRNFGWSPLVSSVRSRLHGTELTLTRNRDVLGRDAMLGAAIGVLLMLIAGLWWLNVQRRNELAQVRLDALTDDAQRLERLVAQRTRALRDSQSQVIQTAKFKVLNDMASGLAHEFSQPLFALEARLDTMALALEDKTQIAALDKAKAQTARMGQILNSLRTFARGDAAAPSLIALSPVVSSALDLLGHRLAQAGITVHHTLRDDTFSGVATAPRLSQVIVNIVSNSIDAMGQGGALHISYGDGPVITIQDSGPGFVDLDQALEPFATTKAQQNGLGLGLSISRDIMRSFGGDLQIGNGEGAGSGGAVVRLTFATEEREQE